MSASRRHGKDEPVIKTTLGTVEEAHRHGVKVAIHARGSASIRAAAQADVDLIYHADLAAEADLDIVAKAGMPIAPVLTSPWIAAEHGAGRGFVGAGRERLQAQLRASYKMVRNARDRGIAVLSGTSPHCRRPAGWRRSVPNSASR